MNSSTSHSRPLFFVLVVSLIAAYAIGTGYTLLLNPEIRFWKQAYAVKIRHAKNLDARGIAKTIFVGGSSCAFQIDPKILDAEFAIPSVNMGMHAGMGAKAILELALKAVKPGDCLVLNLEPGILTEDVGRPSLGIQMLIAAGGPQPQLPWASPNPHDLLTGLQPGLRNVVTILGKFVIGQDLYRYKSSDIHYGGYLETSKKGATLRNGEGNLRLSPQARNLLSDLAAYGRKMNIHIYYLLPWTGVNPSFVDETRKSHRRFASEVADFAPEIRDKTDGISTHLSEFADTDLHLNRGGATRRTLLLGKLLSEASDTSK